jgi:magnesium chelatase family protein
VASQVLVNLRPSHIKKTSRGVELAVAAALLWETEQLKAPMLDKNSFIYGELSLDGGVHEPEDLSGYDSEATSLVITGYHVKEEARPFRRQRVSCLGNLAMPEEISPERGLHIERPEAYLDFNFTEIQAQMIKILAAGEHHAFLAGPAGSGKTTIAKAVHQFLREPQAFWQMSSRKSSFVDYPNWRPLRKPHHSTPMLSMLGGGNSPVVGEIAYAHGGVLLLDELLEFPQAVREALREPMEDARMRIFRLGKAVEYDLDTQILATTNLCICGDLTPDTYKSPNCNFGRSKCLAYLPKLTGPFVDRFDILFFTEKPKPNAKTVVGVDVLKHLLLVYEFQNQRKMKPAKYWKLEALLSDLTEFERDNVNASHWSSHRRKLGTLRLARTLADLDFSEKIDSAHVMAAQKLARVAFDQLKKMG